MINCYCSFICSSLLLARMLEQLSINLLIVKIWLSSLLITIQACMSLSCISYSESVNTVSNFLAQFYYFIYHSSLLCCRLVKISSQSAVNYSTRCHRLKKYQSRENGLKLYRTVWQNFKYVCCTL